jgi:hypothetical protein|tara:strand:- start:382 stop:639 length:258 start_codon:yes stop_codon:yes gene_type:complete
MDDNNPSSSYEWTLYQEDPYDDYHVVMRRNELDSLDMIISSEVIERHLFDNYKRARQFLIGNAKEGQCYIDEIECKIPLSGIIER